MLSGFMDLLIGIICLPVFWLVYVLIHARWKEKVGCLPTTVIALLVFWLAIILLWFWQGGGPVLKAA